MEIKKTQSCKTDVWNVLKEFAGRTDGFGDGRVLTAMREAVQQHQERYNQKRKVYVKAFVNPASK